MTSLTWREKGSRVSFNFFRSSGAKYLSNDCSRPMTNSSGDQGCETSNSPGLSGARGTSDVGAVQLPRLDS